MQTIKQDDLIGKSLTALLEDAGNQFSCTRMKDIRRDSAMIQSRLRSEGLAFATKTLPKFGNHFDSALKAGFYSPCSFFKKNKHGALPLFLRGLTSNVFNTDGTLMDSPDVDAIRLVRQLCYTFYKIEGDYPAELVDEKIEDFVNVDGSLPNFEDYNRHHAGVIYHAQELIKQVFTDFDPSAIAPRPGPGQTADKVDLWFRYQPRVHYKQVHEAYPYYSYFFNSSTHLGARISAYRRLIHEDTPVSRLTTVPKDSRGPRIICMEQSEMMFMQQGLGRAIMAHLSSHPLTRGHVNFDDQTVNGNIALESSKHGRLATLDMKEASDRISRDLVDVLFQDVPVLRKKLLALSSRYIDLPDGRRLALRKYAPMGSALCFPVMSVIHYALMVGTIKCRPGVKTRTAIRDTYVYGDDLIVNTKYVPDLFDTFPHFGLRFNVEKSCYTGSFRESCGIDAFAGTDITPLRVKTLKFDRKSPTRLATHLAYFHGLYRRGLWKLAKLWQQLITETYGTLPRCSEDSPVLGYIVPLNQIRAANRGRWRWNHDLQCIELKSRILFARTFASSIGGWEQLMRSQLHSKVESTSYCLRNRAKFARRWIPISSV